MILSRRALEAVAVADRGSPWLAQGPPEVRKQLHKLIAYLGSQNPSRWTNGAGRRTARLKSPVWTERGSSLILKRGGGDFSMGGRGGDGGP
jgi:hypothetical protein